MKHDSGNKYSELYLKLGYKFKNENFLLEAITHPSTRATSKLHSGKSHDAAMIDFFLSGKEMPSVQDSKLPFNYERLEFLGDKILGFVLGKILFSKFKSDAEGELSAKYAKLANGKTCAKIARKIGLEKYLILSSGAEKYDGRNKDSILENVIEAMIAAIFLDSDMGNAERFIEKHWSDAINSEDMQDLLDPKSHLQQWSQAKYKVMPCYEVVEVSGPGHSPEFCVEVSVQGVKDKYHGRGTSKKEAQTAAAMSMINQLKINK